MIKFFNSHLDDPGFQQYCSIAAATLGAGALSAGASMFGSSKASKAQAEAAARAAQLQKEIYESNKSMMMPFVTAGQEGIGDLQNWVDPTSTTNPLASLIKLVTPGADMSSTLEQTPGYQFSQKQGQRAAMNALAARGLGGSAGAVAKGVADYTQGNASTTWNQVVQNLLSTFGAGTNALQGVVNTGVNAGGAVTGAGTQAAGQIGSSTIAGGNAQAAGYNAIGTAVGGLGNSLTTAALLKQLTSGGASGSGSGSIYTDPTKIGTLH